MIQTFFKVLFKITLALSAVAALLLTLRVLDEQRADYIEIYNDDLDEELVS